MGKYSTSISQPCHFSLSCPHLLCPAVLKVTSLVEAAVIPLCSVVPVIKLAFPGPGGCVRSQFASLACLCWGVWLDWALLPAGPPVMLRPYGQISLSSRVVSSSPTKLTFARKTATDNYTAEDDVQQTV